MKRDINTNFSNTLKGVIRAECSDCNLERDDIELVVDPPLCSVKGESIQVRHSWERHLYL